MRQPLLYIITIAFGIVVPLSAADGRASPDVLNRWRGRPRWRPRHCHWRTVALIEMSRGSSSVRDCERKALRPEGA